MLSLAVFPRQRAVVLWGGAGERCRACVINVLQMDLVSRLRTILCSASNRNFTTRLSDYMKSKKISNDQELIQSDPISCPQNQKGNN